MFYGRLSDFDHFNFSFIILSSSCNAAFCARSSSTSESSFGGGGWGELLGEGEVAGRLSISPSRLSRWVVISLFGAVVFIQTYFTKKILDVVVGQREAFLDWLTVAESLLFFILFVMYFWHSAVSQEV